MGSKLSISKYNFFLSSKRWVNLVAEIDLINQFVEKLKINKDMIKLEISTNPFFRDISRQYMPVLFFKKAIFFIFIFCLLNINVLSAKIIHPHVLIHKIIKAHWKVRQAYFETHVSIFDPEYYLPLEQSYEDSQFEPKERKDLGFQQNIVWIRDDFSSHQILNYKQELLNFSIKTEGYSIYKNISKNRVFLEEDTFFYPIFFYSKYNKTIQNNLDELGIPYNQVSLISLENGESYYQLGDSKNNIIVNIKKLRVEEVNIVIDYHEKEFPLKIKMKSFYASRPLIPKICEYYINNRLLKKVEITNIGFNALSKKRDLIVKKFSIYIPKKVRFRPSLNYAN